MTQTGQIPDTCQSCGGTLKDVPFEPPNCPHCGHNVIDNPSHFGTEQWPTITPRHRDRDPEVMLNTQPREQ